MFENLIFQIEFSVSSGSFPKHNLLDFEEPFMGCIQNSSGLEIEDRF